MEKESEGLAARGSWCMMKRIEGRSFMEAASAAAAAGLGVLAVLEAMVGVVGTGPEWFLTVSCGAAVSARVRVMVGGRAGGEGVEVRGGCGMASGAVRARAACGRELFREGGRGGLAAAVDNGNKDAGEEAGGVTDAARARAGGFGWGAGEGWWCPSDGRCEVGEPRARACWWVWWV